MSITRADGFKGRLWLHLATFIVFALIAVAAFPRGNAAKGAIDSISDLAGTIGQNWWHYAAAIAAVSTLSMAVVEFLKAVLDVRRWYHEFQLRRWVFGPAFDQLIFLAIGDNKSMDALCSQPIAKLMGEIQAAANVVLESPDRYAALYEFLTRTDIDSPVVRGWAQSDRDSHRQRIAELDSSPQSEALRSDARAASKTRLRLVNLSARKLDAFQLKTEYYWTRGNQLASIAISVVLVTVVLYASGNLSRGMLVFGFISGLVAPFMKDFATNLSQFAGKS